MEKNTTPLTATLFKIQGGQKTIVSTYYAFSDRDAVSDAIKTHRRLGLIGRHYLETSAGRVHQINPF